jgi:signal peptidase II
MRRIAIHSLLFVIAIVIILADQFTKYYIRTNLALYETIAPIPAFGDFFTLIHTTNSGAAFGMFKAGGVVFTVVAIVVVAAIVYYYPRIPEGQIGIRIALGLQLGGAIGNLLDRLINGGEVTDFIYFHWYKFLNAPIFNLADLAITTGVIVLALLMWRESEDERKAKLAPSNPVAPHE